MSEQGGSWYAVNGESIKGPFHLYSHAKQALKIPTSVHNDQKYNNELYRYGSKFIGTAQMLREHRIANINCSVKDRRTTHIAIVQGREVNGRIQTIITGPWQKIF
jgi:hypothetical protein